MMLMPTHCFGIPFMRHPKRIYWKCKWHLLALHGFSSCIRRFYASLGSYRLSALVKEEYSPIGAVKNEALASDIRKLVLERLPLFLHERTQTRILLTPEWLSKPS